MAFITAETRSDLIALAVGMLNQAPSNTLLEELIALSVEGGSLADAADHIAKTDAFKAEYPSFQTAEQYATELFDNITTGGTVTAEIRTAVIELATGFLTSGAYSKSGLALAIVDFLSQPAALLNDDFADIAQSVQNRSAAAEYFVVTKELGGSTDAELAAAIASVTSDADTLTAANAAADASAEAEAVVAGQTVQLTTGLDNGSAFVGGAGNDTFSSVDTDVVPADNKTFTTGDSLDGGAGTDTLAIAVSGTEAGNTVLVATKNIEQVAVYNNSNAGYTLQTDLMAGIEKVSVIGAQSATTVDGLSSTPDLSVLSTNTAVTATLNATTGLLGSDEATITLNGVASTTATTITYDRIETLNVVAEGSTSGAATRPVTIADADLETMNVSGDAAATLTVSFVGAANVTDVATFDASEATGAISANLTAGGSTLMNVIGGAGANTFNVGAMDADYTINGGDGVDTLVATSTYNSLSTTGQVGDGVTNMEVLAVQGGTADVRAFSNNTFVGFASIGNATIKGLAATDVSLTMTTAAAGTVKLDRATDGAADAATVTFGATSGFTVATLDVADEESVTINSGGLAGSNVITTLVDTDLTSLTIAGGRDLEITNALTSDALATIDASGLSGLGTVLSLNAAASRVDMTVTLGGGSESAANELMNTITTGRGDDVVTGGDYRDQITTGLGDDSVTGGAGNDTISTGSGADTVDGGDGIDNITTEAGNDVIVGGAGNDIINAGAGDDNISGGDGADTITAASGADTVDGGAGNDAIYVTELTDDDDIDGGAGTDVMRASATATSYTAVTDDAAPTIAGIESARISVTSVAGNSSTVLARLFDMSSVSGMSALSVSLIDSGNTDFTTIKNFGGSSLTLADTGTLDTLTVDGTGQSVGITLDAISGGTMVVTGVAGLSITADTATTAGANQANTLAALTAASATSLTLATQGSSSANTGALNIVGDTTVSDATAITISVGARDTLQSNGQIIAANDLVDTLSVTVGASGVLDLTSAGDEIDLDASDLSSVIITTGTGGAIHNNAAGTAVVLDADTIEALDLNIGAASAVSLEVTSGVTAGTADIAFGGTWDVTTLGMAAEDFAVTVSGDGNITAGNTITIVGADVTFNAQGLVGTNAFDIDASGATGDVILHGGAGANSLTSNDQDAVLKGFNGADTLIGGAGEDTLTGGEGADSITGGAGADSIVLTEIVAAVDQVVSVEGASVAPSAVTVAGANLAAGDTLTFANGLDIVTGFTAGAGGDIIDGVDAAALPTSGIGVAVAAGFTNDTFFISGDYSATTGIFTVTANGAGADTLIIDAQNNAATLAATDDFILLVGVDSDDLNAGNFTV